MNLHLTHDDKFIDIFISNTEKYSDISLNSFIIYTQGNNNELIFVKSRNVTIIDINSEKFFKEITNTKKYSKIYIHYFSNELVNFVNQIPKEIKVFWVFWGADAFNLTIFQKSTFLSKTKKVIIPKQKKIIDVLKNFKREFVLKKVEKKKIKAIKRFDYFAHYIKEDYNLIFSKLKIPFPKYIDFSYADLENYLPISLSHSSNNRTNILIGNSANPANNHLDAIKWLSDKIDKNYSVYCPLSYSGTDDYINIIREKGKSVFNDNFISLVEFIKKEDYSVILKNTAIAVMWHIRSQAWGNIIALLQNGTKVFMSKKSNLYKYLKSFNIIVFTIENDSDEIRNPKFSFLDIAKKNQEILKLNYGSKAVKQRYKNLIENE